jgi:hypothetical protein
MSDESQGPGWWLASDGKWYPPELAPGAAPPQPSYTPPGSYIPPSATATADAGAALSYGWRKFTANVGPLLAIVLIPVGVQIILSLIGQYVVGGLAGSLVFAVISEVVSLMLAIGIFNAGLMLTAGETPDIGRAFSTDRWGEWILFSFVWGLMVGIGLLLCGIGALVVIAIWGLAPYYFIDRRLGLGDSLRASSQTTQRVDGLRIALPLVALVGFLGVFACIIGVFVTMPVAYVGAAYLYRVANNETVAV